MNFKFVTLTVASLGIILACTSAQAGGSAFDAAGNLFVASGHSVFKYAPDGTKTSFATGLRYPLGLSFDGKGNLFVSDGSLIDAPKRRAILKFSPDGAKTTFAPGISSVGLAFDRAGNLLVSQGDSILRFTPSGVKSAFASGLGNPINLTVDGAGNLFVVDMAVPDARIGRSILKFSPDGTKTTFATGLEAPNALAADAAGGVYVGEVTAPDNNSHAILRFDPDGTRSTFSSALGANGASSLAVDPSGNVFVWNGHAVLRVASNGSLSTFASDWLSPDKQWEYRLADNRYPEIVKTGTREVVLDLAKDVTAPSAAEAELIWAPDSKRFGFNYSPSHASHTSYETVVFFQLRGDQWMALRSPVDDMSERSQLVQLVRAPLPESATARQCAPTRDVLKLHNWTAADTAILYAPCFGRMSGQVEAGFLFTLKFDEAGEWKIVDTYRMSKDELDKEQ